MIANKGGNDLLEALPQQERRSILKHCESVMLRRDEVLATPHEPLRHVYFPINAFISLQTELDRHATLGLALIGREGMLGTALALGARTALLRARVQGAGEALRIDAAVFKRLLAESPALERSLHLYVCLVLAQLAQTAACAVFHVVDLRLACWLLMAHDRTHGDRLYLTHARLADMLGVRRSGITLAAGALHRRQLINYTRGHIAIVDRKGLERTSCGCYRVMRQMSKQLASPHAPNKGADTRTRAGIELATA